MSLVDGLLQQNIDYIYSVARDKYGDKTFTEKYNTVKCRWQEKIQQVVDQNGEQKLSSVEVWVLPKYDTIKHDWKITKDSEDYYILAIGKKVDLGGNLDHIKLFLV